MDIYNAPYSASLSPIRKLRAALFAMLMLIGGGTIGFMLLEDMKILDSLYMTIITLSTVGFGEVRPLDANGKIFAMTLIVFGVLVAGSIATFVGQMIVEVQLKDLLTRRKMQTRLRKLTNHFIIAGYGRVGRHVAREFARKKVPFVVVESSEKGINQIISDGYSFVQGDATDDEILAAAGIDRAHTLVSTLPQEAQNVYLTLTSRDLNPTLNIIARADFEEGEKKLRRAGANHIVIPHVLGGLRMAKAALQPNVVDFMAITSMGEEGLLVEELVIPKGSVLGGKSLMESNLKRDYGVNIIGIKQKGRKMNVNPEPETLLSVGDILVLLGRTDQLERLSEEFRQ